MAKPQIVWRTAKVQTASPGRVPLSESDLKNEQDSVAPESQIDRSFNARLRNRLATVLLSVGIPEVREAATPKEDAIGLLMLAAEVEHALMVQYLYAGQSVRGVAGRKIARIAEQEMGHLVTVQNLLLSLTGVGPENLPIGFHLGRDALRKESTHNPLPLILEPVSRTALAKFVVVERPGVIDDEALRRRVEALEVEVEASGANANSVHALYAAIRWIFQADDSDAAGLSIELGFKPGWHLADSDFAEMSIASMFAAEPNEWGSVPGLIVAPAGERTTALSAIDAIAEQGEGITGGDRSHFQDFLSVLDSFEAGQVTVALMPRTPYTTQSNTSEDLHATPIVNTYTLLWARLFNAVYELLVVDIAWSLSLPRGVARTQVVDLCVDTMRQLVQPIASHLAERPRGNDPRETAGPPYELIREHIPKSPQEFRQRYQTILVERDKLVSTIRAAEEFPTDLQGKLILGSMSEIDLQRSTHIPGEK